MKCHSAKYLFLQLSNLNYVPSSKEFYRALGISHEAFVKILDPAGIEVEFLKEAIQASSVVVLDVSVIIAMGLKPLNEIDFYVQNLQSRETYLKIWQVIKESDTPLFIFSPSSDLNAKNFGLSRDLFLELLKRTSGIFWPYYRFPVKKGSIPEKYNSILPSFGMTEDDLRDIWNEIVSNIPINIDLPHCMGESEFVRRDKKKSWDIIIPGSGYSTRKIAEYECKNSKLRVTPFTEIRKWTVVAPYKGYKHILPKKMSIQLQQKMSFFMYREMISRSQMAFTCGSELKYFVRKFLEIPAFRSLLIAYPSENFFDYGFKEGENYIACIPEDIVKVALKSKNNLSLYDRIITQAWRFVHDEHSATNRVKQVLMCLNSFISGKLNGAGYYSGTFEIY